MKVIGNKNSFVINSYQNTFFYVPQKKISHWGLSKWQNYIFFNLFNVLLLLLFFY